jgi:cytochrome c-type biogenesis protein CcmH
MLAGLLAAALVLLPAAALAATPRTSLPDVEDSVMCPSCREPLALAQSVQADDERQYIRGLIAQGLTKSQILTALQAQYGAAVLAKPPAHGFDLTVYVVPPAAVLAGLAALAWALPRWRRRSAAQRAQEDDDAGPPGLAPADAARLEADLARFDG